MASGFDYLEWAFEDLFGLWNPEGQSFSRAFQHPPDIESLYRDSAWIPRILNRAFETLPPFYTKEFNIVSPCSGTGVFWCVPFGLSQVCFIYGRFTELSCCCQAAGSVLFDTSV